MARTAEDILKEAILLETIHEFFLLMPFCYPFILMVSAVGVELLTFSPIFLLFYLASGVIISTVFY